MKRRELAEKHARELGFTPGDCARWLAPAELARTAVKVGLAGAFAAYADKREVQESFESHAEDLSDREELWFDFVADLGDGFDPTYTVAWAIAQPSLEIALPGDAAPQPSPESADRRVLPAGELLVMGGDQVYPASSAQGYEDRTTGPYRSALPASAGTERLVLAIPGNHDWYDGLTSFLRTFTQGRVFGGWRTRQSRSYFVAKLPHGWWLVGVDTQLAANVDEPQLRYLNAHLSSKLKPGDGVILCTAAPTWVHTRSKHDPDAFNTLHFLERNYVRRRPLADGTFVDTGAAVRLWLTGDSHHYARFAEVGPDGAGDADGVQFITCGLGGAYLSGTRNVPAELDLPPAGSRMRDKDPTPRTFRQVGATYPDKADSEGLAWGLAVPGPRHVLARNPTFGLLMAGVYLVLFTMFSQLFGLVEGLPAVSARRSGEVSDAVTTAVVALIAVSVLSVALAVRHEWRFMNTWAPAPSGWARSLRLLRVSLSTWLLWGLQLTIAAGVFVLGVVDPWNTGYPWLDLAILLGTAVVVGALVGSEAFALYVRSVDGGMVEDWQMSGQAIEDRKGFLRLRLSSEGLEVRPLVIDEVCRNWEVVPTEGGVRPVPAEGLPPIRQLEPTIKVSRTGAQAAAQ
jgi:hypothetical protein